MPANKLKQINKQLLCLRLHATTTKKAETLECSICSLQVVLSQVEQETEITNMTGSQVSGIYILQPHLYQLAKFLLLALLDHFKVNKNWSTDCVND